MSSSEITENPGMGKAPFLIRPFEGVLPRPDVAARVAAPPYDVVTADQARDMAGDNPLNFLHVSRPEIDFPKGTDPYSAAVYARAGETMRRMIGDGVLRREAEPAYYVYRIEFDGHTQTGLVTAASVEAYRSNRIRRHEVTRPDKEDDRVRQVEAVNAHTGPVLAVHRNNSEISIALNTAAAGAACFEVDAPDGSHHSIWKVTESGVLRSLTEAFEAMDAVYIADGHHRSAAADRVAAARGGSGSDPSDYFLMVSFPENDVRILGYHRAVRDLNGLTPARLLEELGKSFAIEPLDAVAEPRAAGEFAMYLDGRWHRLVRAGGRGDESPVDRLDVSVLSRLILAPVLGIGDVRRDPRIDFVGGRDGLDILARRVDSGEMAVGFALYPTQLSDLFAVADAGEIMPPKSTWFDPKLLDGMVSYPLD